MNEQVLHALNRSYRSLKTFLLKKQPPIATGVFFRTVSLLDRTLSTRNDDPAAHDANWRQKYLNQHQDAAKKFTVDTRFPVASISADHLHPRGTIYDNSSNYRFNQKVYELFHGQKPISIMDLGCAGGGMVRSFLEDGHVAIGLEGSDISKTLRSGEWEAVPFHLFTCDLTKPFQVRLGGTPFEFDLITAWEVLEHIATADLGIFIDNIRRHLKPDGYFIGSVDLLPDGNPVTGAVYHQTVESADWWKRQFCDQGFVSLSDHPFGRKDMVRGNGMTLKDWNPDDGTGIHLVLQKELHDT
jgi:2-polyprenyl-3-methyl-5-hydroxy-6-metoxy-1,4-benzoquinol methylase